jgi:teichoic acid transport system permease protein
VLQLARGILMGEKIADWNYWWYFTAWSLLTLLVGLLYFWSAEERYGRD